MSIRLDKRPSTDGRTLDTRFANFKSEAIDKAQWISERAAKGEFT